MFLGSGAVALHESLFIRKLFILFCVDLDNYLAYMIYLALASPPPDARVV